MRTYRVFGLDLRTGFRFTNPLARGTGDPDLIFECRRGAAPRHREDLPEPVYSSPYQTEAGASVLSVHRLPSRDALAGDDFGSDDGDRLCGAVYQ